MGIKHKSVGASMTQTEFETASSHVLDAVGIPYATASAEVSTVGFGTDNCFLQCSASVPQWASSPTLAGDVTMGDNDLIMSTATGSKIGTASTQKLAFFGATPIAQPLKGSYNNWASIGDIVGALVALGIFNAS